MHDPKTSPSASSSSSSPAPLAASAAFEELGSEFLEEVADETTEDGLEVEIAEFSSADFATADVHEPKVEIAEVPSEKKVIIAEPRVDRTQKFSRASLREAAVAEAALAQTALAATPPPAPVQIAEPVAEAPADRTQKMSRADFDAAKRKAASLAPVSMDIEGPPPPSATVRVPRLSKEEAAAAIRHARGEAIEHPVQPASAKPFIAMGFGAVLLACTIIGMVLATASPTSYGPLAPATPRIAEDGAHQAIFDTPPMAKMKVETPEAAASFATLPVAPPSRVVVSVAAPESPHPATPRPQPSPPPEKKASPVASTVKTAAPTSAPAPAPQPAVPAAPVARPTTGTVRVADSLRAIQVDGTYVRVNGGAVVLPCGRHKIQAGFGATEVVDVPCGGAVSLAN